MQTITLTNSVRRLKVGQKGNSAYISIPKNIMEALGIDKGDTVLLGQTDGVGYGIVISTVGYTNCFLFRLTRGISVMNWKYNLHYMVKCILSNQSILSLSPIVC